MIERISIQNFKSLKNVEFKCGSLNILSGLNGMGKSSLIQSLLLLKQSNEKGSLTNKGLSLKGDWINIGTGKDAFNQYAEKEEIKFSILFKDNEKEFQWIFGYSENEGVKESQRTNSDILPFGEDFEIPNNISSLPLFDRRLKYLSADRWVRNQYEKSDDKIIENKSLGKNGEYTTHYLLYYGTKTSEEVNEKLLHSQTENKTLQQQVNDWMTEISPGTIVSAGDIPGVDAVKLRYQFTTNQGKSDDILPTNVGFGMTYVLPVLVALLSAKPGDILIIENPESHVHPKGQSAIGRLMGKVASTGVQLFVETHSDHILNGACIAINKGELKNTDTRFFFLIRKPNELESIEYEVPVAINGRVDDRELRNLGIEGFFDQINRDLETILFSTLSN